MRNSVQLAQCRSVKETRCSRATTVKRLPFPPRAAIIVKQSRDSVTGRCRRRSAVKSGWGVMLPGTVRLVPARLCAPGRRLTWKLFVARK
jgi:hypothetical protein